MKGLIDVIHSAIKKHKTATVDKPWDGPKNKTRAKTDHDPAYFFKIFAFQDKDGDPKKKTSYRFVHHEVSADGTPSAANVRGCINGIAVLNGARGGTTIPTADRKGVWDHLAAHLKDADMEPTPLRSDVQTMEKRMSPANEMRVAGEDGKKKIEGYAAVFNSLSVPMFGMRETIKPGAFKKTIQEADIRALWNHDPNFVLGRSKSGTLELKEDEKGLFYRITPPDAQWAQDLVKTISRGDVSQSSFAFKVIKDNWHMEDGEQRRELIEVRLFDVSPVTFPAYEDTDSQIRNIAAYAGMDSTALHEAVRRAMMGAELRDEDKKILAKSADFLRTCADVEPDPEDHSTQDPEQGPQSLSILRSKLDLLSLGS